MRLPFVTRESFDFVFDRLVRSEDRVHLLEQRVAELTTMLTRPIYTVKTAPEAPVQPAKHIDIVARAIAQVGGTDAGLRAHLARWVREQRASKDRPTDEQLVSQIIDWPSTEDDDESQAAG